MSPEDWGNKCPHEFIAGESVFTGWSREGVLTMPPYLTGYRLEYDNSWTQLSDIVKVDDRKALIDKVMNQKLSLKDAI